MPRLLVLYYSMYAHIETMTQAIAEGARAVDGVEVTISAGSATVGTKIVATATDANGNTSEFSAFATVA